MHSYCNATKTLFWCSVQLGYFCMPNYGLEAIAITLIIPNQRGCASVGNTATLPQKFTSTVKPRTNIRNCKYQFNVRCLFGRLVVVVPTRSPNLHLELSSLSRACASQRLPYIQADKTAPSQSKPQPRNSPNPRNNLLEPKNKTTQGIHAHDNINASSRTAHSLFMLYTC